jgi:hypothetical protein
VTCGPNGRSGGAILVALVAELRREVEHNRDRRNVVLPRHFEERLAALGTHVGRVNHREPSRREALRADQVQQLERVFRRSLVHFVVADHSAEEVGREHFGWLEVLTCERGLPATGRANQKHQRELGNVNSHERSNLLRRVPANLHRIARKME